VSYGVRSPVPLSDVFCTLLLSTVGEFKGTFPVYVSQSMNVLLFAVAILSSLGVTGDLLRVEDTVWDMRYETSTPDARCHATCSRAGSPDLPACLPDERVKLVIYITETIDLLMEIWNAKASHRYLPARLAVPASQLLQPMVSPLASKLTTGWMASAWIETKIDHREEPSPRASEPGAETARSQARSSRSPALRLSISHLVEDRTIDGGNL
jgi:enamine deaminase RidA (YjgF/YER057c/UK114 family)